MTASFPFTVNHLPLSVRHPFSVIREASRSISNGKCMVNSELLMANGRPEAV